MSDERVLVGKLWAEVAIKAPAHKFHEMFWRKPHHISNICPQRIHKVDLHEGDWGSKGSVIQWTYSVDGKPRVCKQIIEADEQKKTVTFKVIGGDVLKEYKSTTYSVEAIEKGDVTLVHWTVEYEKLNKNVRAPQKEFEVILHMTEDIDNHLVQA